MWRGKRECVSVRNPSVVAECVSVRRRGLCFRPSSRSEFTYDVATLAAAGKKKEDGEEEKEKKKKEEGEEEKEGRGRR